MFCIEDFGHVFAIAFALSAIFYYVELREVSLRRLKQALDALTIAQQSASDEIKKKIAEAIYADMPPGGIFSLRPRTKEIEQKLAELERERDHAMRRLRLLRIATKTIIHSHILTHVLAGVSTTVSLGSLLYAGFHPDDMHGWKFITLLLGLSFLSIIWNLGFYMLVLPKLTKIVA